MYSSIKISEFLHRKKEIVNIDPDAEYALVTVKLHHKGVVLREKKKGSLLGSSMYKISKGQFILSGIDARNGAFGIVPDELDGAIITNDFWCFDVDEKKVKRDFFYWLSNTPLFLDACVKSSKGETQRIRLQKDLFFNFEFHFPPINMQEDFLQSIQKFDFGLSVLGSEQTYQSSHLTRLRQTILQEGIEGKLTAKWRDKHPDLISGDNHASKLLEKIKAEKERLIKEGNTSTKLSARIKKDKPISPITDEEKPFELPSGWVWCRLGDSGVVNPRNYINHDLEVSFSPMALISEKYGIRPMCETKKWGNVKKGFTHFAENDVAIAKITPCFENSKACVFEGLLNGYGAGTTELHVLRPITTNSKYVYIFFKTPSFLADGERRMTGVCGQKRVPVDYFSNALFPLAPLAEQQAIVDRVDNLMTMINDLENQVSERKDQAEMLMQSVLREAFAKE